MASAYLSLDDTNDNIRTHDLKIENTGLLFCTIASVILFLNDNYAIRRREESLCRLRVLAI